MDEKDPKDEELNPQEQDNLNEADDSFGLPDLDYKPLDEESSEEPNTEPEEDSAVEEEENTEDNYTSSYSEESEEEEEQEKPALRYQMEEESSNAPKIIGGIIGVLVLAAVIWYFGFYGPQQKKIAEAEQAKQEELDYKKAQDAKAALKKKQEAEAAAAEAAQVANEVEENTDAEVEILSERSGRYYIVLESFIDEDFAKDFGNKIAQEGTPSFLIPPYSKKKMQRVAIGGYDSMEEAKSGLNNLPEEYGTGKWILKY